MNKRIVIFGTALVFLGIILGAFGAHALKEIISGDKLIAFETGVRYQIYHGLAFLILGFNADKLTFDLKWIFLLMITGVILFSGSIYLLAIREIIGADLNLLGPLTPVGGSLMMAGWGMLAFKLLTRK